MRLDKIFNFESITLGTNQQNLIEIYRRLHPTNTEYTFILGAYATNIHSNRAYPRL